MSKKAICQKCGKMRKKFRSNNSMRVGKDVVVCRPCAKKIAKKISNDFFKVRKREAKIAMPASLVKKPHTVHAIDFNKECICYHCVKRYADLPKNKKDCICDGACDSAPDEYIKERCELCDVKNFCDIFENPGLYIN